MLVQLMGDHELIQLLPHGGIVLLISFNYPVDRALNITVKKFSDGHHISRDEFESAVVGASEFTEKSDILAVVNTRIKHQQRSPPHL